MAKKIKYKKTRGRESFGDLSKVRWKLFIACLIIVFVVAGIGSAYTQIDSWYESVKPSITPPNWVFPVVWTVLFYFIAVSMYYNWLGANKRKKSKLIWYYGINFFLNILWSILFFTLHKPAYAFFEIILLLISIAHLIVFSWKIKKEASYFLIPYLIWVGFASILNYLVMKGVR
ncbi:MAG: TspO/MBR family protein [Nanoarchaeota archaeon]